MALDVLTLCVFLVLVQLPYCSMLSNQQFTFDNCDRPRNDVHIIDGAEVTSQNGEFYAEENTDCKMKFKTPSSSMRLLIQFTLLDVRGHSRLCRDNLTLTDLLAPEKPVLLDKFCGALSDLHGMSKWQQYTMYTKGDVLEVHWVTGVNLTRNRGFQLTLTALTQPPVQCPDRLHMRCSNGDCISKDLQCDGVKHCRHGKDEQRCNHGPVRTAFPPAHTTRTSDMPVRASEVYLWIPLMVVVAFTIVLLSLIFIGRRPGTNNRRGYHSARLNSDDVNNENLRLEINTNPGYLEAADGMPATPPPSYSYIERQTSYVSHISVNSDQMSIPPGYDEALDLPDTPGGINRNRRPGQVSRSSTGSGRSRLRRPHSRSSSTGSGRRSRFLQQSSVPADMSRGVYRSRITSDSVFIDPPPGSQEPVVPPIRRLYSESGATPPRLPAAPEARGSSEHRRAVSETLDGSQVPIINLTDESMQSTVDDHPNPGGGPVILEPNSETAPGSSANSDNGRPETAVDLEQDVTFF